MSDISYAITANNESFQLVGLSPDPDPSVEFPAIIGNIPFSFTVSFGAENAIEYNSLTVNSKPEYVTVTVVSNNAVIIERDLDYTLFPDENYDFVRYSDDYKSNTDFTFTIGEYRDANKEGLNLYAWNTPSQKTITGAYSFTMEYTTLDDSTETDQITAFTFNQEYQWDSNPGLVILNEILDETSNTLPEDVINTYLADSGYEVDYELNANTLPGNTSILDNLYEGIS